MWGRTGRTSTKRSEGVKPPFDALRKVRGRLGQQGTKHARTTYGSAVGRGVGALAVVVTISLLLLLRRRAMRNGGSSEEVNEEPTTDMRTTILNIPPELAADDKRLSLFAYLLDNTIDGKTLLDLGAGHCKFSKSARAASYEVTAVDTRTERLPDDLDGIRFIQADVRNFDTSGYDVILILGLLYHLTIADQEDLLSRARGATVVVDTQVHDPRKVTGHAGEWAQRTVYKGSYEGIEYPENDLPMASIENPVSFWHTEPSLLTLFGKCGYNQAMIVEPKYISKYGARGYYILS